MAEVLGIVAGATQLLDLSARLVLASSHLYTNLKNVPEEIEALKKNTQDFHDLLWMISSDLDGPLNSNPNSLHVTHRIVSIFNDAMKESEELAILLERLSNKSSRSAKRLWSSVAGLKEKTEIAGRGRRIDSLKASIQMWYQHQSIMRLRAVEHRLSTITHSQLATQSSLSLLTQQSARAVDINNSLAIKLHSHHHAGMNMAEQAPQQHRRPTRRNKPCTCIPSISLSHVSKWNFQLFLDRKATHSTDCSLHTDTTTWSFGLRALNPKIQVMLGLHFGGWSLSMVGKISPHNVVDPSQSPAFIAILEARRSLHRTPTARDGGNSPAMIGSTMATCQGLTALVVNGPPFNLFYQRHIESICMALRSSLLQAFASGRALPGDRTPEGDTALSRFLDFTSEIHCYQESLFNLLSSIVETLTPNDTDSILYLKHRWSTPIYDISRSTPTGSKMGTIMLQQLRLDGILISHGFDEISDEYRRSLSRTTFVGIFIKYPCLLENYGQNPVHLAIVQRSETKLRELLDLGKIDLKVDNPPLLILAIGWPAGLKMLLNAGAEPSVAIEEAILQQQLQSISLLLDHGCPIFSPHRDLLDFSVRTRVSPNVVLLLLEKLAGMRQDLLQLALDHLPEGTIETTWCNYHSQPRPLLDYNAIEIYEQLKAHRVAVPEALWPGPYTTIYHSPSVHNCSSLAMKLYELGFHDIDKTDDHGMTPLIQAIRNCGLNTFDSPRLIQCYLDLGVTLEPRPFLTHLLSESTYFPTMVSAGAWISKKQKLYNMLPIFRQLIQGNAQKNDDCRCWCSTAGCTPVGVVLRKGQLVVASASDNFQLLRRRRWLYLLPRYSPLGLDLDQNSFTEICRLEIFDRLGMAHTCCHRLGTCPQNHFPIRSDELKELQEEDQILKEALDLYLELYLDLLQQHQGSFETFWISWWFAVDHLLPFECRNWGQYFQPLHLLGFPKDELLSKAQDVKGYNPHITAITSTVHSCVILLDSNAIDTFLGQFEAALVEESYYGRFYFKWLRHL